jgi:hypothetical protein
MKAIEQGMGDLITSFVESLLGAKKRARYFPIPRVHKARFMSVTKGYVSRGESR